MLEQIHGISYLTGMLVLENPIHMVINTVLHFLHLIPQKNYLETTEEYIIVNLVEETNQLVLEIKILSLVNSTL